MSGNHCVIGLGFGDEGKGRVVDNLCRKLEDPVVVRFSGGHQAAHTVYHDGKPHIFSNFGSGTLVGAPTFWSRFCTFNPVGAIKEYEDLRRDFGTCPRLYIHPFAPVVTPFDIAVNQIEEERVRNGSCGYGYGTTLQREEDHYHLQFHDLGNEWILKRKLENIRNNYYAKYEDNKGAFPRVNYELQVDEFIAACRRAVELFSRPLSPEDYENIVFEGSQGLLLDKRYGFYPNVTRGCIDTTNIDAEFGVPYDLHLVTRAYLTRHGNGPFPHESDLIRKAANWDGETCRENAWQGALRYSSLNMGLLRHAAQRCITTAKYARRKTVHITCMDKISADTNTIREACGCDHVRSYYSPENK